MIRWQEDVERAQGLIKLPIARLRLWNSDASASVAGCGQPFTWDADKLTATGNKAVTPFLREPYRKVPLHVLVLAGDLHLGPR